MQIKCATPVIWSLSSWLIKARQELEKIKRRLETEINDLREQLLEKRQQVEELQGVLSKREEEVQFTLQK